MSSRKPELRQYVPFAARWIGGGVDVLENVSADRLVTVTEGTAKAD
ncbi:MAG: hypothetical protein HQ567_02065 [Candidatus Nealsonbacteria bacterium]|nr:hypothetical protein [Candidatus Nealsonbacteria bacterium]